MLRLAADARRYEDEVRLMRSAGANVIRAPRYRLAFSGCAAQNVGFRARRNEVHGLGSRAVEMKEILASHS